MAVGELLITVKRLRFEGQIHGVYFSLCSWLQSWKAN